MTNPSDIPPPLPWDQRAKGVGSMPGGYRGYIQALHQICEHVVNEGTSPKELASWVQRHFELSEGSAKWRVNFLKKAGVFEPAANPIHLSDYASRWHGTSDHGILIGLLHSRLQFFGEMLAELSEEPRSLEELRQAAKKYDLNWDSDDQGHKRRGWLESAKLIEPASSGQLAITDEGRDLLAILVVHSPSSKLEHPRPQLPPQPAPDSTPTSTPKTAPPPSSATTPDPRTGESEPSPAEALAFEIRDASTDSKNPDRLEFAVRDAFEFLGFDAEKLGGSGKTDVHVKAPLGKDSSYSVTIDAKTVGAGSLGDGQVDWVTLDEHKKQHNADYSMLVGPNPSSGRLMARAGDQSVAVLSTDQLAELCLQHADAPLGLEDYRALFDTGGPVDMASISRAAQDLTRLRDIAAELCAKLAERTGTFGPLTASQLIMILDQPDTPSSAQEIQQVLNTLAAPLVGAVLGTESEGYVLATDLRVTQQRLQLLGDHLSR